MSKTWVGHGLDDNDTDTDFRPLKGMSKYLLFSPIAVLMIILHHRSLAIKLTKFVNEKLITHFGYSLTDAQTDMT